MDRRAVKAHVYTWIAEDYAEYWKLIGLSLGGSTAFDGSIYTIKIHFKYYFTCHRLTHFHLIFVSEKIIFIRNDNEVQSYEIITRCQNCSRTFSSVQFDEHICDFSDPNTIIYDDEKINILWENSSLRKMYAENDAQIEQILHQYGNDVIVRQKEAKKHLVIQGNHECAVCHRIYVHASGLARHMETQHYTIETKEEIVHQSIFEEEAMAEVIKCLICGRVFNSFSSCFSHLKSSHTEYGFDESKYSFQAGDSILFEKLTVDQLIRCEFCDLLFADTLGLLQHKNTHSINTGYECSSCQLASRNLKFIINHRNSECPYEMYEKNPITGCKLCFVCSDCTETFDSLAALYDHRFV